MGEVSKPSRMRRYTYANNVRASRGADESVVYALLLNVADDVQAVPYHVGQSLNLQVKLSHDRFIAWHFQMFARPAVVQVLGAVGLSDAQDAQDELITSLQAAGFKLGLPQDSMVNVIRYARQRPTANQVFTAWGERWLRQVVEIPRTKPGVAVKSKRVRQPAVVDITLPITRTQVRGLRPEGLSIEAAALHARLVKNFDEATQQSRLTVPRAENVTRERADLDLLGTCVELRDIWRPQGMIPRTNKKLVFSLTGSTRKTLLG